ncbi:MAG: MFS transporter, partial [Lactobacillus crispatus]|nr:MFS transporter [Lactobacillus crispatus]MCT7699126.1 MFS transporter [Lactobacillus crispatus]
MSNTPFLKLISFSLYYNFNNKRNKEKGVRFMNVFLKNADFRRFSVASFLSGAGDILFYLAFMTYASKLQNYSLALSLIAIS